MIERLRRTEISRIIRIQFWLAKDLIISNLSMNLLIFNKKQILKRGHILILHESHMLVNAKETDLVSLRRIPRCDFCIRIVLPMQYTSETGNWVRGCFINLIGWRGSRDMSTHPYGCSCSFKHGYAKQNNYLPNIYSKVELSFSMSM